MKNKIAYFFLFVLAFNLYGQNLSVTKVEPENWWAGMKLHNIQLMVYGKNLKNIDASFNTKDIQIIKINKTENHDYLFIDIDISSSIKPNNYVLTLSDGNSKEKINFPILQRESMQGKHQGFSNTDAIYLIMPDRFANGDVSNDRVNGIIDDTDPKGRNKRHGGDLQGVLDKLDYIKDLGCTAIWINPILENNTAEMSYHGYAATDLYKVDPRLGSNELYKKLVDEAHKKGLKIIFDHIANHIGVYHPWVSNLPIKDWLNGTKENHFGTNHNKSAFADIHADSTTIIRNTKGWFVDQMPDLNQENPYVAKYLTQNMIWWIEYSGLDGIREDTYPYPDQKFMSNWDKAIQDEYPDFNIVGEVWVNDPATLSYYQMNSPYPRKFNSYLPSLMDFAMMFSYQNFLSGTVNIYNIYETLAKDFVYANPNDLVTFMDNHDQQRGGYCAKGDLRKVKLVMDMVLTARGIPQILYGTEIGMVGGREHPDLRLDFPGGFPGNSRDAFTSKGRTKDENDIFDHIQKLLKLRQQYPALSKGKFTHYPPENDIYYYVKSFENQKIICVMNGNDKEVNIDFNQVSHLLKDGMKLKNLLTGDIIEYHKGYKVNLEEYKELLLEIL